MSVSPNKLKMPWTKKKKERTKITTVTKKSKHLVTRIPPKTESEHR